MMSMESDSAPPPRNGRGWLRGSAFFTALLDRFEPSSQAVLFGTALLIGLGGGLGAVIFRYLIRWVESVGYDWFPQVTASWGKAYVVIVPVLGGLLVGPMIYLFAREAKGHGVPEVMEAVALRGGRIRPIVGLIKSLASSICIGSGGSVGREGPIVQIGSALGSSLGQVLRLSDDRIRNLVACGAAAGIAATFNAPIAGVFFALEIILGEFHVRHFSTVVISSVAASVVGRAAFGNQPAFAIPTEYGINSLWEFGLYTLLGVAAALVGVLFVRALYWTEDVFERWKRVPEWVQPAVGSAMLGGLGLAYPWLTGITWERMPQIFNVGYDVIEGALGKELVIGVVMGLLLLKLIATSLTLGSGGSGGVFAPSLFMGAMLGQAFELGSRAIFPDLVGPPGAYALVGMAAVFAAAAHAPITAVLILFELTGDYRIILPLMLTVVVATLLARRLLDNESIYTLKLSRRGVHLQAGRDVDVMQSVQVHEVMSTQVDSVNKTATLNELSNTLARTHHHGLVVLDDQGQLWGIVTVSDLDRALDLDLPKDVTVEHIATPRDRLVVAYPDESMGAVLSRMSVRGLGRMPVVARQNGGKLEGIIRRQDIIRAYDLALTRRSEVSQRADRLRKEADDTDFVEIGLDADSAAVGHTLQSLGKQLPRGCVLVSIQRDGRVFIPHGDTQFQEGDRVTVFVTQQDLDALRACLEARKQGSEEVSEPASLGEEEQASMG